MTRRALPAAAAGLVLAALAAPAPAIAATPASSCDGFAERDCLMPFPNDMNLTVRDRDTPTKRRVRLPQNAMPATGSGQRVANAEYNRNDGFSPGQTLVVRLRGLDNARAFRRSRLPSIRDLGQYRSRRVGLVVVNARTRRRHLVWAELDSRAPISRRRVLLIHPGRNFTEGARYIVALRNLRTSGGRRIASPRGFAALKRGAGPRRLRARYRGIFRTLRRAGVSRASLTLAWDFTVASRQAIQARMLRIRNDAFRQLGDADLADRRVDGDPPAFAIERVDELAEGPIARRISGTFTVPCYLNVRGCPPGARFNYAERTDRERARDALPVQLADNTMQARLECHVPRQALATPARAVQYGHGLLGRPTQIDEENLRAFSAEHNAVMCATAWTGFAEEDVATVALPTLRDLSNFPKIADRSQQGHLNQMFLTRLMRHPRGLVSHPAFQAGGRPVMDPASVYFYGNSQGGIYGGALVTMSPDFDRGVLGVPGINFSVLLMRSSNWDLYGAIYEPAYPNPEDRQLGVSLIQMLWDRAEGNGWVAHLRRDPPPGTPTKEVLLHASVGDWQVTTFQADAMARTIGARARRPAVAPGRRVERTPLYGIPSIPSFPYTGSALVYWDAGPAFTGIEPATNTPPRGGRDSHYSPRNTPSARRQIAEFLRPGGAIVDVCGAGPCVGVPDDSP